MAEFPLTNTASDIDVALQKVVGITTTPTAGNSNTVTSGGVHAALQSLNHTNMDAGFLVTEAEGISNNDTDTQIPTCAAVSEFIASSIKFASYTNTSGGSTSSDSVIPLTEAVDVSNIGSVSSGEVTLDAGTYLVFLTGSFQEQDSDTSDFFTIKLRHNGSTVASVKIDETGTGTIYKGITLMSVITSTTSQTVDVFADETSFSTVRYRDVSLNFVKLA